MNQITALCLFKRYLPERRSKWSIYPKTMFKFSLLGFCNLYSNTVEPSSNKDHENCLLYQVSHYIRVKKQRNIKSLDQQNYLFLGGYCYIWSPEWSSTELAIHSHTPQPFFKLITGLFSTCKSNFNIFNGCKFSEILVSLFMCILNSPLVHKMGAQWVLPCIPYHAIYFIVLFWCYITFS